MAGRPGEGTFCSECHPASRGLCDRRQLLSKEKTGKPDEIMHTLYEDSLTCSSASGITDACHYCHDWMLITTVPQ